jgi:hypothetical protein
MGDRAADTITASGMSLSCVVSQNEPRRHSGRTST